MILAPRRAFAMIFATTALGVATASPPLTHAHTYVGYAPMVDFNTDDDVWVRRGVLVIDGDRVAFHASALICRGDEVWRTESDDGRYEYEGGLSGPTGQRRLRLQFTGCDSCNVPEDAKPDIRTYDFHRIDADRVEFAGVRFDRRNPADPRRCPSLVSGTALPPERADNDISPE